MRLALAVVAILTATAPAATADDDATVDAGNNAFFGGASDATESGSPSHEAGSSSPVGTYHQQPACADVCTGNLTCPDGTFKIYSWLEGPDRTLLWESYWCPSDDGAPAVTEGLVAYAFQRIPLPPSTFSIQPPGGKTLVNFETNFFTEERSLDRTVRLLGQRVDLRIEAHSYTWHFDDGESVRTTKPGAPYPNLQVTHNYLQTGGYRPALDITWVADYRVNGGAWQAVPGSVTIEGSPSELRAIEARPTLVGYK